MLLRSRAKFVRRVAQCMMMIMIITGNGASLQAQPSVCDGNATLAAPIDSTQQSSGIARHIEDPAARPSGSDELFSEETPEPLFILHASRSAGKTASVEEREERAVFEKLTIDGTSGIRGKTTAIMKSIAYLAHMAAQHAVQDKTKHLIIGYDTRDGSEEMARITADIISRYGIVVTVLNEPLPSPMIAFEIAHVAAAEGGAPGRLAGIVITGSHNPTTDNGFCLYSARGAVMITDEHQLKSALISVIHTLSTAPGADGSPKAGQALFHDRTETNKAPVIFNDDPSERILKSMIYSNKLFRALQSRIPAAERKQVRVIYDSMKGAGDQIMPEVFRKYEFNFQGKLNRRGNLITKSQGRVCLHPGDREPYPRHAWQAGWLTALHRYKANFLVANDGDADRFAILDQGGGFVDWNELFILAVDYCGRLGVFKNEENGQPYTDIVATETTTHALEAVAGLYDIRVHRVKVGFKHVVEKMDEIERAGGKVFGGFEGNGGLVLRVDNALHLNCKDGIAANLFFSFIKAESIAEGNTSLREDVERVYRKIGLSSHFGSMQEITLPTAVVQPLIEEINRADAVVCGRRINTARSRWIAAGKMSDAKQTSDTQDERHTKKKKATERKIVFDDGSWCLVRQSGTEARVGRIYLEAPTRAQQIALGLDLIEHCLKQSGMEGAHISEGMEKNIREWVTQNFPREKAVMIVDMFKKQQYAMARKIGADDVMSAVSAVHERVIESLERTLSSRFSVHDQRSTIDVNLGQSKASAIIDYGVFANVDLDSSVYFGDRYRNNGNDAEVLRVKQRFQNMTVVSVEKEQGQPEGVVWAQPRETQQNVEMTRMLLNQICEGIRREDGQIKVYYNSRAIFSCDRRKLCCGQAALLFDIDGTVLQLTGDTLDGDPEMRAIFAFLISSGVRVCFVTGSAFVQQKERVIDVLVKAYPGISMDRVCLYTVGGAARTAFRGSGVSLAWGDTVLVDEIDAPTIQVVRELITENARQSFGLPGNAQQIWRQWYEVQKGKRLPLAYDASWLDGNKEWYAELADAEDVPHATELTFPFVEIRKHAGKVIGLAIRVIPSGSFLQSQGFLNALPVDETTGGRNSETKDQQMTRRLEAAAKKHLFAWPTPPVVAGMTESDNDFIIGINDIGVDHHAEFMMICSVLRRAAAELGDERQRELCIQEIRDLKRRAITNMIDGSYLEDLKLLSNRLNRPLKGATVYSTVCPCQQCLKKFIALEVKEVRYISTHPFEERERLLTQDSKLIVKQMAVQMTPWLKRQYDIFFQLKQSKDAYEQLQAYIRQQYAKAYYAREDDAFKRTVSEAIGVLNMSSTAEEIYTRVKRALDDGSHEHKDIYRAA